MSDHPRTVKAQFFTKDRTEFDLWDEGTSEFISEMDYCHKDTEFPVLPVAGDVLEWAGGTYRVVSRIFSGNGGVWSVTLHVKHEPAFRG